MNTDVLNLPSAFDSPASYTEDVQHWSGVLLEKLKACENHDIFPNFGICHGLRKLYLALLHRRDGRGTGYFFDYALLAALALLFIAFLSTSIYTIYSEDKKSLKEISNKVRRTTDAIMGILRSFWILKEVKVSNLKLEEECKKILKMKLPQNFFDGVKTQSLTAGKYISVAEIPSSNDGQISEVIFTQEEDFPVESDWSPPEEKGNEENQNENNLEASPITNDEFNPRKEHPTGCIKNNEQIPSLKENIPVQNKFSSLSSSDLCEDQTDTTGLEIIPEGNLSDGEDISPKKKWIVKKRKIPGSGRIMIPPYPKEFQVEIRKEGQIKGGIFEHRRQNLERAKRSKSFEQNPFRGDWNTQQQNSSREYTGAKVMPRRSSIVNRSTHKFPLPSPRTVK